MKIKLEQVLENEDGSPAKEGDKDVTVRQALKRAALAEVDKNLQPIKGDEKVKRYDLFLLVKRATEDTDFKVEDIAALRDAVLVFPTFLSGQLRDILN